MRDGQQFLGVGLDQFERVQLLLRIHHESHGTLGLIPY
jgi:hypothetical protein